MKQENVNSCEVMNSGGKVKTRKSDTPYYIYPGSKHFRINIGYTLAQHPNIGYISQIFSQYLPNIAFPISPGYPNVMLAKHPINVGLRYVSHADIAPICCQYLNLILDIDLGEISLRYRN